MRCHVACPVWVSLSLAYLGSQPLTRFFLAEHVTKPLPTWIKLSLRDGIRLRGKVMSDTAGGWLRS